MSKFLIDNASAFFALFGALSGAFVTGLLNFMLKKRETKLRIAEKLLDKKLEAHESLIELTSWIRTMVLFGGKDQNEELIRSPLIMQSHTNMDNFLLELNKVQTKIDRWLSAGSKREASLFLDYFVNLNEFSQNATDEALQNAGAIIRNDFIEFALRLENCAHDFFNKELMKLNFKTDRNWHKYPKEKTYEELNKTALFKNKQKIIEILNGSS